MSALDDAVYPDEEAVSELAQLRAKASERDRIAEAVNEARELIEKIDSRVYLRRDLQEKVSAWLAAHPAPAPDDDDENQPALLTASGYFTDWPEEDAPAQPDERMFDE